MPRRIDRRRFLETTSSLAVAAAAAPALGRDVAGVLAEGAPHAEQLGWRLGCQAYSFRLFTFAESVDKVHRLGLRYIEAYPGQPLSPERPDVQVKDSMSASARKEVQQRLGDAGIELVNYGVCALPKAEAISRKTFDFAAAMGIETVVSEPEIDALDTIEKLCDEYRIRLAIHNHPKPSRYWNPDTVLEACRGRSDRIGACADTGHWLRSQLDPVEQLRKLQGRLVSFHLKDLNRSGSGRHDVPWGTGQANVEAMLGEIHRQGVQAVFSIEYEHNWENSLPEIAQCVLCFDRIASNLAAADALP